MHLIAYMHIFESTAVESSDFFSSSDSQLSDDPGRKISYNHEDTREASFSASFGDSAALQCYFIAYRFVAVDFIFLWIEYRTDLHIFR